MSAAPPPTLRTPRFLLREIVAGDHDAVFAGLSDPAVIEHYGVSYATRAETRVQMDWFARIAAEQTGRWWAICRPEAPAELLGCCGFNDWSHEHRRIELGYWMRPAHQRRGVMRECLPAVVGHAFDALGVHRIEAVVEPENIASCALLEALGFAREGLRRDCEVKHGRFVSLALYGLLASDARPACATLA